MILTVVGGQFGSEGKGAVVGQLAAAMLDRHDLCVRVAGPNAGHTVYDGQGRRWALRQVPAAAPVSDCRLIIAAGSEIDPEVLLDEVRALDEAGHRVSERLWIHPAGTMIAQQHKDIERKVGLTGRIGSTGKGIGAARAARIMRDADLAANYTFALHSGPPDDREEYGYLRKLEWGEYPWGLDVSQSRYVMVEGTQGYGLGLHTDFYPKVTSSDCRAIDFLAMAGIPALNQRHLVVVVVRPYPIRVAGDSGPLFGETTWDALGLDQEKTTVTGKVRRVGVWDPGLVASAVQANGGAKVVRLALMMLDHVFPMIAGATTHAQLREHSEVDAYIKQIEADAGAPVWLVGTGPQTMAGV